MIVIAVALPLYFFMGFLVVMWGAILGPQPMQDWCKNVLYGGDTEADKDPIGSFLHGKSTVLGGYDSALLN